VVDLRAAAAVRGEEPSGEVADLVLSAAIRDSLRQKQARHFAGELGEPAEW
jgi:hypothetical protein